MSEKYFPEKKELFPQIYAYELPNDSSKKWLLKVWYTTREDVKERIHEQIWATRMEYRLLVCESAMREDGTSFDDHEVHKYLENVLNKRKVEWEWFVCNDYDVKAAIRWVRERNYNINGRTEDFPMRPEQEKAVEKTSYYFKNANRDKRPIFDWVSWSDRFFWNYNSKI